MKTRWIHAGGGCIIDSSGTSIGSFSGDRKYRDRMIMAVNAEADAEQVASSVPEAVPDAMANDLDKAPNVIGFIERLDKRLEAVGFTHAQRLKIVEILVTTNVDTTLPATIPPTATLTKE